MWTTWMISRAAQALKDERGLEVLEWVLVGAFITGIAILVYGPAGGLGGSLTGVVASITSTMSGAMGGGAS
jgi:Flp pilus assembly pilin Flp